MNKHIKYIVFLLSILLLTCNSISEGVALTDIYIRVDQVGYLPNDLKSGVILSNTNLSNKKIKLIKEINNKEVLSFILGNSIGVYGNFKYSYTFDFSKLVNHGKYFVELENVKSQKFEISDKVFNHVVDSLMVFFKVQRCGYTNPYLHEICHKADVSKLINKNDTINTSIDLTGGWHDAGDYTKFVNTIAYTTYTLLFSFEFSPEKFGFDNDKSGVPDILEEAKIGLDWLLRSNYQMDKFVTQVQDWRDQQVGWRMPEKDPLEYDRPGFVGMGKNLLGIYVAAMSIASRIWREKLHYDEFAEICLTKAENLYSIKDNIPDIDSSGTGMYIDNNYLGKLALGSVEFYLTTLRPDVLEDAVKYADKAGSDYWWSWGDINSFADYKLAKIYPRFKDYIYNNLVAFNTTKNSKLFSEGAAFSWGTTNTFLGISLQTILYKDLTNDIQFDSLAVLQRDYILGRNQWGVSFISKIGTNYTKNFHHQVGHQNKGYLPGALAAGPVTKEFMKNYNIEYDKTDRFSNFQTDAAYYRDDRHDYITNEPTITSNATAVFVFGYYSSR
ncbi:MAG: glycoside hydrolase family 9 protein [bacterium]